MKFLKSMLSAQEQFYSTPIINFVKPTDFFTFKQLDNCRISRYSKN